MGFKKKLDNLPQEIYSSKEMARTIDNLGIETSSRYAEDQTLLDQKLLKEIRVPVQAQIDVTQPSYSDELDRLFEMSKSHALWASFSAPLHFYAQKRRLFSELTIPQLGTIDKREVLLQKLLTMGTGGNGDTAQIEKTTEEKKALITLLNRIESIDKDLIDINSKRTQYQKG